jgi:hypothetical protein
MRRQICLFLVAVTMSLGGGARIHGQTVDRTQSFRTPDKRYEVRSIVWKLRSLKQISSATPGRASQPGGFYQLSVELLRYGSEDELEKLLKDENPLARVMGFVCLAQLDFEKHTQTLRARAIDKAVVTLAHECVISHFMVGRITGMLLKNPDFLGHTRTGAPAGKPTQNR